MTAPWPEGYTVYKSPRSWWNFPYTVMFNGRLVDVRSTLWGARRLIAKDRRERARPLFWESPIVHQEKA